MLQPITATNNIDSDGNPAGGSVYGRGIALNFQNGPFDKKDTTQQPNGVFLETVIHAAKQRIEFYQSTKFACPENHEAIVALEKALDALRRRTAERESRGVEGTHTV